MNNKVLIELSAIRIEKRFEVFVPASKKISNVLVLLVKALHDLTDGEYPLDYRVMLCNQDSGAIYGLNQTVKEAGIQNGTRLLLV